MRSATEPLPAHSAPCLSCVCLAGPMQLAGCLNPTPDPEWGPLPSVVHSPACFRHSSPLAPILGAPSLHTTVPFLDGRMCSLCSDLESPGSHWVPEARHLPLFLNARGFRTPGLLFSRLWLLYLILQPYRVSYAQAFPPWGPPHVRICTASLQVGQPSAQLVHFRD